MALLLTGWCSEGQRSGDQRPPHIGYMGPWYSGRTVLYLILLFNQTELCT